jgi:lipopolysaccharide export system protein LptC
MTVATRTGYWLLLVPLVGLLGVTYWLNMQTQTESIKSNANTRHSFDALIENFSATKMDTQGLPHFIVSAKQMHHYSDDDSTTLKEPILTTHSNEGVAIRTTANQGTISSKGEEVFLQDHVEMLRDANAQHDKLTLKTEYLHVIPDKNLITTDRAVTLTDANTTVNAIGLEMDYKMRTFKLLSRVRSEYNPVKK